MADGIKLLTKEDLVPGEADVLLFRLAPYVSFAASYAAFLALPFANGWVAQHLHTGVFFVLAVLSLEVFRDHPRRVRIGVEVVAVWSDARSGTGRQL